MHQKRSDRVSLRILLITKKRRVQGVNKWKVWSLIKWIQILWPQTLICKHRGLLQLTRKRLEQMLEVVLLQLKVVHSHVWSLNSDNNTSQNECKQGWTRRKELSRCYQVVTEQIRCKRGLLMFREFARISCNLFKFKGKGCLYSNKGWLAITSVAQIINHHYQHQHQHQHHHDDNKNDAIVVAQK